MAGSEAKKARDRARMRRIRSEQKIEQAALAVFIAASITPWTDPRFHENVVQRIKDVLAGKWE